MRRFGYHNVIVTVSSYSEIILQFLFQILPQLLSHLNVDKLGTSLDWGILCVYTCKESCSIGNHYVQEVIFKQDLV